MKQIDEADAVLVVVTRQNGESASLHEEAGYALAKTKLVVPMVEEGASLGGPVSMH